MDVVVSLILALLVAAAVVSIGWRALADERDMAEAMGLALPRRRRSLDDWARHVDAGLTGRQIVVGGALWLLGGLVLGLIQGGGLVAVLYAAGTTAVYWGTLQQRRQERRMARAEYMARALDVIQTLLHQGRPLVEALEEAAVSVPPVAREVLHDLVVRLRSSPGDAAARAVREWDEAWDNPAVDMTAAALLTAIEGRMEVSRFVDTLRASLREVVEILRSAHAEAKGVEWQTRFLAFWPPLVLAAMVVFSPGWASAFRTRPYLVLPALLGSVLTYMLTTRDLRANLSVDAAVGLPAGGEGEIRLDRMGKPL